MENIILDEYAIPGRRWGWLLATGLISIVLGVAAFAVPVASTVGIAIGLATLLFVGGIVQLFHAVSARRERGETGRFIQSLISIVAGILMYRYPGGGMLGIAIALSFYFFISAASKWILASSLRPAAGWGWGMASSLASFLLGIYIIATFPFSALWVPGTLLGIDLVFAGITLLGASLALRRVYKERGKGGEKPAARAA